VSSSAIQRQTTDIALSLLKQWSAAAAQWIDGTPLIVMREGRLLPGRLQRERIDPDDILEAARAHRGLDSLDQVETAVLERSGKVSVIPKSRAEQEAAGRQRR
jgi:uncharacterized membrane protein YcaP (DUF421 family)